MGQGRKDDHHNDDVGVVGDGEEENGGGIGGRDEEAERAERAVQGEHEASSRREQVSVIKLFFFIHAPVFCL